MKGKIVIVIALVLLISSVCQASDFKIKNQSQDRSSKWVIMVYLNGDNLLSAIQGQVLESIRNIGSVSEVNYAVLIDQNEVDDTRLYYIVGTSLIQQTWPSESSMDDYNTIVDFVNKVKSDYSSDNYALFLSSNKGSAWQGVCWDDHGDGIMITMPELLQALNEVTNSGSDKLDVLAIETCMTGNMEVAYQIKSCVNYFVAYSECAIGGDWPYSSSFTDINNDPDMTPEEFSICIVNHFVPRYVPQYQMKTTMASTDLSYLSSLGEQINDLALFFINNLDQYKSQITTALESARIYALSWEIDYYIDFYNFLDLCTISNTDFNTIKGNIQSIMDTAVVANNHLIDDPAHGLSIYFPRRAIDYNDSLRYDELPSPYEETLFAIDTSWEQFLRIYLGIENNSPPEKPIILGPNRGAPNVNLDFTISAEDVNGHQVYLYIDWGDGNIVDWDGPYDSNEEVKYIHSWTTKDKYNIKVKAKDELGVESDWGSFEVNIPRTHSRLGLIAFSFLFGKITGLEKTEEGNFRFLPLKVYHVNYVKGQGVNFEVMDETYGEYPCCGYIPIEEFKGTITETSIRGIWITNG